MNHPGTLEHRSQESDLPFGFVFGSSDEPAPVPDAPAAGEPLLNDIELNNSNLFFDRFQNDYNLWDDPKLLESLGSLQHEPLPSFQGISVTLPQNALSLTSPIQNVDFSNFGHDLTSKFGQAHLASPNTPNSTNPQSLHRFSTFPHTAHDSLRNRHRHSAHMFQTQELFDEQQRMQSRTAPSRSSADMFSQETSASSHYDQMRSSHLQLNTKNLVSNQANGERHRPVPPVRFGSDLDFQNQQYDAPGTVIMEAKSREAIFQENLKTFESKWNGESTAPPSPAPAKRRLSSLDTDKPGSKALNRDPKHSDQSAGDVNRTKKPKIKHDQDEDGSDNMSPPLKKSKSKQKSRTLSDDSMAASRRKSQLAESKSSRQNLTEEEKKQNHIRSEQKRRNQIRQGFADLMSIMPGASSTNLSKCAVLGHAVDWYSRVVETNKKLKAQLTSMSG